MDDNKINKNMTTNKQETQPTAQVQKQPGPIYTLDLVSKHLI